jgi:HlyD family secretion protein
MAMMAHLRLLWDQRTFWVLVVALPASGLLLSAVRYRGRSPAIPTFVVERGTFIDSLQFRGEVKALKSVTIVTPTEVGGSRVLKLAADGTSVKPGDTVVEFDATRTEQDLAQYKSALKSAQAQVDQVRAQARLTEEADQTAVMKARYDVEAAKLDASKQEVVSQIEGAEAKLKLADAEQTLHELEEKLKADHTSSQATIQGSIQASRKAAYDVQRAERALTTMTLRAPVAGIISLVPIWHQGGPSPLKPGDLAWPGAPIAELPDVSTLRIHARVEETDRGRLAVAQAVTAHMDAIADREFSGTIEKISTIATSDFSGGWPFPRNFDLGIAIDQTDARLKPGMTAQLTVIIDKVLNALTIPVQASFRKSGQTVAYVWAGSHFRERVIEIGRRSGDRILVVKGLQPNDRVALSDPTAKE